MSSYELEHGESLGDTVVHLSLAGELDLTNALEVEERLVENAADATLLVLDLNRVVFIDSAALHVLFKLAQRRGPGRVAIVVDPGAPIARVLEIVGLGAVVRVGSSIDEFSAPAAT